MYRCQVTGLVSKPKEPQFTVTIETRPVRYINKKWDEEKRRSVEITSTGFETVKELRVSATGKQLLEETGHVRTA